MRPETCQDGLGAFFLLILLSIHKIVWRGGVGIVFLAGACQCELAGSRVWARARPRLARAYVTLTGLELKKLSLYYNTFGPRNSRREL